MAPMATANHNFKWMKNAHVCLIWDQIFAGILTRFYLLSLSMYNSDLIAWYNGSITNTVDLIIFACFQFSLVAL